MRKSDPTPGDEVEFRGACDALTLASGGGALVLPSIVSRAIADDSNSPREQRPRLLRRQRRQRRRSRNKRRLGYRGRL